MQPIEPVFVDYKKDMSQFEAQPGIDVLYKKNETNDIFTLIYVFNTGTENDPALNLAFNYLSYLGSIGCTCEVCISERNSLWESRLVTIGVIFGAAILDVYKRQALECAETAALIELRIRTALELSLIHI